MTRTYGSIMGFFPMLIWVPRLKISHYNRPQKEASKYNSSWAINDIIPIEFSIMFRILTITSSSHIGLIWFKTLWKETKLSTMFMFLHFSRIKLHHVWNLVQSCRCPKNGLVLCATQGGMIHTMEETHLACSHAPWTPKLSSSWSYFNSCIWLMHYGDSCP